MVAKSIIDWSIIDRIANALGVSYDARAKWRQRNHIPHKWRIHLINNSDGALSWADFKKMDNQK